MSVIAEFEVETTQFLLADMLTELPEAWAQFERVVPSGERTVPLLWVYGSDPGTMERNLLSHPMVQSLNRLESSDDRALYAIEWAEEPDSVLEGISEQNADILDAVGSAEVWRFELRFPSHRALSAFKSHCDETEVQVTPTRIYRPEDDELGFRHGLTDRQVEVLVTAAEEGYFDVPRRLTAAELGTEFDISNQAVSERLRRGMKTLVMNTLASVG
ncbi:helix-turn-helix domain-containing protein [Halegenticoccus tardaugens]|uniref:helix-turn-helix domain-containing protein n=1 Tax=Halegenticoccus tardaugens TaxID=2071624 RepID=UPI00100B73C7|nr:helix-turn-helix domain-containing protein [Halegenticoccus tardaugens]